MNWIDWSILIILGFSIIGGASIGLTGVLLNTIATFIAWVAALLLAAPVKNIMESLFGFVTSLAKFFEPAIPGTLIAPGTTPLQAILTSGLPEWSKGVLSRIAGSEHSVSSTSQLWAYWIANVIIVVIIFFVLLVVFGILFRLLLSKLKLTLPNTGFIHSFDRLLGAIIYLFMSSFVLFGLLVIFISLFPAEKAVGMPVVGYVYSSFFGGLVYGNFLGVQTIYGSLYRLVLGY